MRHQPEVPIGGDGLNHTEVGIASVGPLQSGRLEASGSLSNPRDRTFRSTSSCTISTLDELESVDMRFVHEAIDGA